MIDDHSADHVERVKGRFPETIEARGEITVSVTREALLDALDWLANGSGLKLGFLSSVTATDWPGSDPRFWVVYELRSIEEGTRVRVKVGLAEGDAHVPSVTPMFPTANWHERETYDFFGIVFDGHPDLSRILLPDGWEGYPLLKTEPLGGVNTRFHGAFIPPVDERTTT